MVSVIICIEFIIIFLSQILKKYYSYDGTLKKSRLDYSNNSLFTFIVASILVFFSGFRGDFSTDYSTYTWLYYNIGEQSFKDVILNRNNTHSELLFRILNKFLHSLGANEVVLFFVLSLIIVTLVMKAIIETSESVWFSSLMFVTTGLYFLSFNQVRVVLAGSLVFWGMRFLYSKKIKEYVFVVLLASLLHTSALIMLLFILIDVIKMSKKLQMIYVFLILIICFWVLLNIRETLQIVTNIIYTAYGKEDSYGMHEGLAITSIVIPIFLGIVVLFLRKKIDYQNRKDKIWVLGFVIYFILSVGALKVIMLQWVVVYFQFYTFLLIPELLSRCTYKRKELYTLILTLVLVIYSLNSSAADLNYYFCWS